MCSGTISHVRLIDPKTRQLLREHLRAPRGYHRSRIATADPTPPTTLALLGRAATAGASIGAVCRHIHAQGTAHSVRQLLGVRLGEENTAWPSSKTPPRRRSRSASRRIASSAIRRAAAAAPLTLKQVDPLIRQLTLYRDLIDQKTEPRMTLVEVDRALRKLRLSGMADVLETRLRHAQAGNGSPPSISWPRSSPTSSAGAKTGCWPAGTARASATPIARPRISFRLQQENEPRAHLRPRDRALHPAARGRALSRPNGALSSAQAIGRAAIQQGFA